MLGIPEILRGWGAPLLPFTTSSSSCLLAPNSRLLPPTSRLTSPVSHLLSLVSRLSSPVSHLSSSVSLLPSLFFRLSSLFFRLSSLFFSLSSPVSLLSSSDNTGKNVKKTHHGDAWHVDKTTWRSDVSTKILRVPSSGIMYTVVYSTMYVLICTLLYYEIPVHSMYPICTVQKVINFRDMSSNMKCRGKQYTSWHIPHRISFSPLHFITYCRKSITFGKKTVYIRVM